MPVAARVVGEAASSFEAAGAAVDPAYPDLGLADDTFRTLRAWHFQASLGELLAAHPDSFKQSLAAALIAAKTSPSRSTGFRPISSETFPNASRPAMTPKAYTAKTTVTVSSPKE